MTVSRGRCRPPGKTPRQRGISPSAPSAMAPPTPSRCSSRLPDTSSAALPGGSERRYSSSIPTTSSSGRASRAPCLTSSTATSGWCVPNCAPGSRSPPLLPRPAVVADTHRNRLVLGPSRSMAHRPHHHRTTAPIKTEGGLALRWRRRWLDPQEVIKDRKREQAPLHTRIANAGIGPSGTADYTRSHRLGRGPRALAAGRGTASRSRSAGRIGGRCGGSGRLRSRSRPASCCPGHRSQRWSAGAATRTPSC